MAIASYEFLILFFPITLFLYYRWLGKSRHKMFFVLFASYVFYGLAGWKFIPLLFTLSLLTLWSGKSQRFGIGIILNLIGLVTFKYWNFGVDNFNLLMQSIGLEFAAPLLKIGLPLGLSFFVFKHIGYLLDVQLKRYKTSEDFWTFATFSAYFPQISAGPISSYHDTASQFSNLPEKLSREAALESLIYISWGLIKKVLIADALANFLPGYLLDAAKIGGFLPAWYIVIAYTAQLYFDFSGYTDMALGISGLFGVKLPGNFNSPYLAANAADFWERWHMSLSRWFRYYLFSPMSRSLLKSWGSSNRERAQYAANLLTMSLVGLWHGAGWSYILWGAYHGILLSLNAWWKRTGKATPIYIERSLLIIAILIGWAVFMSPNGGYLVNLFKQLFGLGGLGFEEFRTLTLSVSSPVMLTAVMLAFSGFAEAENLYAGIENWGLAALALLGVLAAMAIFFMQSTANFIYVQF